MIVWLLDLDLGGTVFRFATETASVTDGSSTYVYRSGLAQPTVEIGSDGPSGRSVGLTIDAMPVGYASWVDVPQIRWMLETGTATLRRWKTGTDRKQARVVASGGIANPSLARGHSALVLSLESPPWQDGTRFLQPTDMVTTETYPSPTAYTGSSAEVDPMCYGAFPAIVVGYPGDVRSLGSGKTTPTETSVRGPPAGAGKLSRSSWAELGEGVPALLVEINAGVWWDQNRIAIAAHPVAATKVIIWDQSSKRWDLLDVSQAANGAGRTFSYVDFQGAKIWLNPDVTGNELWAIYLPDYGGGLPSDKGGTMEGLGEFLVWSLSKMSAPVALAAQKGQRPMLDDFKLSCGINTDITVWEWVKQEVLDVFPVRWIESHDGGGYLRFWDLNPGAVPVAHLDTATQAIEVVGDLLCETEDIRNHITLRYSFGPDGVHKTLTYAAEADGTYQRVHPACVRSEALHGRRAYVWESRSIKDDATAQRAALGLVRRYASGVWTFILNDARSKVLDTLDPGDRVRVTASEIGLSDVECIVVAVVYEGRATRAVFRLVEED